MLFPRYVSWRNASLGCREVPGNAPSSLQKQREGCAANKCLEDYRDVVCRGALATGS